MVGCRWLLGGFGLDHALEGGRPVSATVVGGSQRTEAGRPDSPRHPTLVQRHGREFATGAQLARLGDDAGE